MARIIAVALFVLILIGQLTVGYASIWGYWTNCVDWERKWGTLVVELGSAGLIFVGSFIQWAPPARVAASSRSHPLAMPSISAGTTRQPETDGLAITALVLSIFGMLGCLPLAVAAPILGSVSRNRIRESHGLLTGDGLALAGIIIGFIAVALSAVVLFVWIAASASAV